MLPAEELGVADFGKPGSRLSIPFPPDVTAQASGAAAVGRRLLLLGGNSLSAQAASDTLRQTNFGGSLQTCCTAGAEPIT